MGMLSVLKREVQHTGWVALYLFMCFSIFATLNKLFLALHQIATSALVPAVLFTLALAKVVVLLDLTSLSTHLDARHPILVATLYKTLIYCAFSAPILFAERALHFYEETGAFGEAFVQAWEQMDRNRVLAKFIILGLVYGCYHLYHGIDRRLGEGSLWRLILSRG